MTDTRLEGGGVFIRGEALQALADRAILRDPAGRTARPHLVPTRRRGEWGIVARGPFSILVRYRVERDQGIRFCRATGDDNSIHFEGTVVPGAYTAAKVVLPLEVLFPELEIAEVATKFSAISSYERAAFAHMRCAPEAGGGLTVAASMCEEGAPIAEIDVRARPTPAGEKVAEVARRKVNVERLRAVRSFIQSLGVAPHAYFRSAGRAGYFYPRAFLASLPSGAMVRTLRGEGGLLNKLSLEFDGARVPITSGADPAVTIERPKARKTFNKILAAISYGIKTYVRGTALVLSRAGDTAAGALPATPTLLLPGPGGDAAVAVPVPAK